MKPIDFLPDLYRQRAAHRQAKIWWCAVALIFGAALASAEGARGYLRWSAQTQLAAVEPAFLAAKKLDQRHAELTAQVTKAGELAGLYAYLRHPWPRTQLLAALVEPLPAAIELEALRLTPEQKSAGGQEAAPASKSRRSRKGQDDAAKKKLSAEAQDLVLLRGQCDAARAVAELEGHSADLTQLHEYVARLAQSSLVARAELKSVETLPAGQPHGGARFHIRVEFRPGYGQPEGPSPSEKPAAETAAFPTGSSGQTGSQLAIREPPARE